jgi:hypothetical protein
MESPHERALRDIEEAFGDRLKRGGPAPPGVPDAGDALTSVSPMSVEEVKLLAEVAGRYSVPLVALGAGMASKGRSHPSRRRMRFNGYERMQSTWWQ